MRNLAIIILNWNGSSDTIDCLESLSCNSCYDIYVLDNNSSDRQFEKLVNYAFKSKYSDSLRVIDSSMMTDIVAVNYRLTIIKSSDNLGFAGGNNFVTETLRQYYEYLLLLNNDTEVPDGTIDSMLSTIRRERCVALTCDIRYFYDKDKLWNAGGEFKWYGDRKYYSQEEIEQLEKKDVQYIEAEYITGCAMLLDSSYIREYGMFTEAFFHGEEDYNFCYRAKIRGARIGVDLSARIYHKVGQSISRVSNSSGDFNGNTVHYLNRVIDYKEFYTFSYWFFWRYMYLLLVLIRRLTTGSSFYNAFSLVYRVLMLSNRFNNVKKPVFDYIMNGNSSK